MLDTGRYDALDFNYTKREITELCLHDYLLLPNTRRYNLKLWRLFDTTNVFIDGHRKQLYQPSRVCSHPSCPNTYLHMCVYTHTHKTPRECLNAGLNIGTKK